MNEKKPTLGSTTCCRNQAYQPCTAGLAPEDLAKAPATNPASALPLVPQTGEVTFSHPARNQDAPTSIRNTNHSSEAPVEPRKNFEIAGSGKRPSAEDGCKAERSCANSTKARINARTNMISKATPQ